MSHRLFFQVVIDLLLKETSLSLVLDVLQPKHPVRPHGLERQKHVGTGDFLLSTLLHLLVASEGKHSFALEIFAVLVTADEYHTFLLSSEVDSQSKCLDTLRHENILAVTSLSLPDHYGPYHCSEVDLPQLIFLLDLNLYLLVRELLPELSVLFEVLECLLDSKHSILVSLLPYASFLVCLLFVKSH